VPPGRSSILSPWAHRSSKRPFLRDPSGDLSGAAARRAICAEAVADVVVLRPARPNGLMLLDIPNRGRKLIGPLVEESPTDAASRLEQPGDAGRGFLLSRGYTVVWVGWQAALAPGGPMRMEAPVVPGVQGPSREEWVFDHVRSPVTATLTWPAADLDPAKARLTVRAQPEDPRSAPADLSFRYLDAQRIEITRPAQGFSRGSAHPRSPSCFATQSAQPCQAPCSRQVFPLRLRR
jgi:hypothetical protein